MLRQGIARTVSTGVLCVAEPPEKLPRVAAIPSRGEAYR